MPCLEALTAAKDIVSALAAIAATVIAGFGLQTWNRQLRGTADFETARIVARSVYKVRDEMAKCRHPIIFASEFRPADGSETSSTSSDRSESEYRRAFVGRWETVTLALTELDVHVLEAEALWGTAASDAVAELKSCAFRLSAAIEAFLDNERTRGEIFYSDPEFGKKIKQEVFAYSHDGRNEFSASIANAVSKIETVLRPHLKRT